MSVRIAISIGDYNGIGPEVAIKSLQKFALQNVTPIILGSDKIIKFYLQGMDKPLNHRSITDIREAEDGEINVLNCLDEETIDISPGTISTEAGRCAMQAVELGIELCMDKKADALVTASISKEAVNKAGYRIPGHTEFLAGKTGTEDYLMMMINDELRVGLVSTHIPLDEVASTLSEEHILKNIRTMNQSLKRDFGIEKPRIAVLGLNPHAGDGGLIGVEEQEIIGPAVEKAGEKGIDLEGPFPADGFFGSRSYTQFDGILAMYHDQGLVPFKTLSFGKGVNFTAGLPIIRTSPDHGTAFDIAGKNRANPASFKQAFELAVWLAGKKSKQLA